ncbi:MAG: hypothetical protein MUF62_11590 [Chitinophagaceae bacterium]|nr:hypothetical protein [Chitinophagaceae bacterium]
MHVSPSSVTRHLLFYKKTCYQSSRARRARPQAEEPFDASYTPLASSASPAALPIAPRW